MLQVTTKSFKQFKRSTYTLYTRAAITQIQCRFFVVWKNIVGCAFCRRKSHLRRTDSADLVNIMPCETDAIKNDSDELIVFTKKKKLNAPF